MKLNKTISGVFSLVFVICLLSFNPCSVQAATVYLIPTGNSAADLAAFLALTGGGHTVTLGVEPHIWNGTQANLANFDAVVILNSFNITAGSMPLGGTTALVKYVSEGGGIATDGFFASNVVSPFNRRHPGVESLIPVTAPTFNTAASTTYDQVTAEPTINSGVPATFSFNLRTVSGSSEVSFDARPDLIVPPDTVIIPASTVFYSSSNGGGRANSPGLVGWNILMGKVLSFSTAITDTELASDDFKQLLVNAVNWVARPAAN